MAAAIIRAMMTALRAKLPILPGTRLGDLTVSYGDEFAYDDPVDGSHSAAQGLRIGFEGGGRVVFRLSGTGTVGSTVRVYLEQLETDPSAFDKPTEQALSEIASAALNLSGLKKHTGRDAPNVIT